MMLAAIVAHDPHLVIGKDGELPWRYPEDLRYFKNTTMNHPIIMGRKVFEGLDNKPLKGRQNIVLSKNHSYDEVHTCTSIKESLQIVEHDDLAFVIGGGEIYQQFLPRLHKLFVTEIHEAHEGDTYFPEYRNDIGSAWKEIKRDEHQDLSFVVYDRME